jgi:hypothetical protein
MNRYYVEPIGWLLVCLLIMLIAAVAIAPLGMDDSQSQLKIVSKQSALVVKR